MGWQLGLYRAASWGLPLIAPLTLKKRLAKGKEDPQRWREKLGEASLPRPDGPLIWLHAVGLGEVLALRGLVVALSRENPALNFLLTSTARSSGLVVGAQLPPRTQHQFLPLDAPQYLAKFLAHWRPDMSIWAEQDLWPGAVLSADQAGIPLVMVNARMNEAALAKRMKAKAIYSDLLSRFRIIAAQDAVTAQNLALLGAQNPQVTGSLKAAAPALLADDQALASARGLLGHHRPWLLASSHPEDEDIALGSGSDRLLIIAPRDPHRATQIAAKAQARGLKTAIRSQNQSLEGADVYIADTFGEMGLWYRLCDRALIGGTFSAINGHNPWEPAALGCAILHGPKVANFANDFAILQAEEAALKVTADSLGAALQSDLSPQAARAQALWQKAEGSLQPLAQDILKVMA